MNRSGDGGRLTEFIQKMKKEGLDQIVIDTFAFYYEKLVNGETGSIPEKDIRPLEPEETVNAGDLGQYADFGETVVKHAVMIVLNGGLGTSMGLTSAKSLIVAKAGKSFLAIKLAQAESLGVRICFMNSFNTHGATLAAISKIKPAIEPIYFLQNKFPKILRNGLAPVSWPKNTSLEWNPPGHGDIYTALHSTGTLQKLLEADIRYAYICNSDNIGGTVDVSLLGYFAECGIPFMMEVSQRGPLDRKGGHLARLHNGRMILREIAQCPNADIDTFQNIDYHRYFNTNSIWINLQSLNQLIETEGLVRLPMILNPKPLDPRDESSPPIYHIETAMGSAISIFEGAQAVQVGKIRFLPVKTCNDLLVRRSDRFLLTNNHKIIRNPETTHPRITVHLDPTYYRNIDMFDQRFPEDAPSLCKCRSLTIEGDVRFESNVKIIGNVTIRNKNPRQAVIKKDTVIDRDLIL